MNPVDIVFGVFILIMAIKGIIKGFIRELFGLVALLLGIFSAHQFHMSLGNTFVKYLHITHTAANVTAFFILFFLVYLTIFFVGVVIASMIKKIDLGFIDRVFGFTFGVAKAAIVIVIIVLMMDSFPFLQSFSNSLKKDSRIYSYTEKFIYSTDMINRVEQIVIKRGKKL